MEVSVRYHPFIIDPKTPLAGEDKQAYCRNRGWGGSWKPPDLKQWKWWPNTQNAHRLCVYLEELSARVPEMSQSEQDQRNHALVRKYYELTYDRDCNISTPEGAAQAIEELGFGKASDAVEWLREGGGLKEVNAKLGEANASNVHSVPHYIVTGPNERQGSGVAPFGGAQDSRTFYKIFKQLAKQ